MFGIGKSATRRIYINVSKIIIAIIHIGSESIRMELYVEMFFFFFCSANFNIV